MYPYIVYVITNRITGKKYVGRTKCGLKQRWSVHLAHARHGDSYRGGAGKSYLYRSMRKHGIENFTVEVIVEAPSFDEMVKLEAHYIRLYDTINPEKGYNLVIDEYEKDGVREFTSPEVGARIAEASSTKYDIPVGVSYDTARSKWTVCLKILGKRIMKRFDTKIEAQLVADKLRLHAWGIDKVYLYFPERLSEYMEEDLELFFTKITEVKKSASQYKGVKLDKHGYHMIRVSLPKGGRIFVGVEKEEDLAVAVYDQVHYFLWRDQSKLNRPSKLDIDLYLKKGEERYQWYSNPRKQIRTKSPKTSRFNGVCKRSKNTWEMSLAQDKDRIREIYASEEDAAYAYDWYIRKSGTDTNRLNFPDQISTEKPRALNVSTRSA